MADGPPQSFHLAAGSFPCPLKISTTAPPCKKQLVLASLQSMLHQPEAHISPKEMVFLYTGQEF